MNNAEHKLHELRNQLDQLDTATMHSRVATNLRSAYQQQSNLSTTTTMEHVPDQIPDASPETKNPGRKNWRMLGITFGGLSLAGLALVTTLIVNVNDVTPPTSTTTQQLALSDNAKPKNGKINSNTGTTLQFDSAALGSSDATGLGSGINLRDLDLDLEVPNLEFEPMMVSDYDYDTVEPVIERYEEYAYDDITNYPNEPDYTYTNGKDEKQVFSESVGLTIEVKDELLSVMNVLRTEVTNRSGYLVNISYYNDSGTINIKIPADQLAGFEEKLSELDANHEVEVNQYNVQNVSAEVVAMDEYLKIAEDQVTTLEETIASNETSEGDREDAKEQLETTKEIIEQSKKERDEAIAKYNLVNVTVYITKYESIWEGNYYQYDRSTLSGLIKYEFGRAVYSLVRSTGKVTTFFVWLLVYSVIFVPAFYIIRGIVRKIRKSLKK